MEICYGDIKAFNVFDISDTFTLGSYCELFEIMKMLKS